MILNYFQSETIFSSFSVKIFSSDPYSMSFFWLNFSFSFIDIHWEYFTDASLRFVDMLIKGVNLSINLYTNFHIWRDHSDFFPLYRILNIKKLTHIHRQSMAMTFTQWEVKENSRFTWIVALAIFETNFGNKFKWISHDHFYL